MAEPPNVADVITPFIVQLSRNSSGSIGSPFNEH
jgi:hypothetical protein